MATLSLPVLFYYRWLLCWINFKVIKQILGPDCYLYTNIQAIWILYHSLEKPSTLTHIFQTPISKAQAPLEPGSKYFGLRRDTTKVHINAYWQCKNKSIPATRCFSDVSPNHFIWTSCHIMSQAKYYEPGLLSNFKHMTIKNNYSQLYYVNWLNSQANFNKNEIMILKCTWYIVAVKRLSGIRFLQEGKTMLQRTTSYMRCKYSRIQN